METGLTGRVVMLTGGARNIGRETALMFAEEGAQLSLCTRGNVEGLEETVRRVKALGANVISRQADVADPGDVRAWVDETMQTFGRIDVVINNAVYRAESGFLEQSYEEWSRNLAVNLGGPFNFCQAAVPHMRAAGFGRIINYSGIAPFVGHGPAKANTHP